MKKKVLALVCALAFGTGALAGCGASEPAAAETAAESAVVETASEKASAGNR